MIARVRTFLRDALRRRADLDAEMEEEFRHHMELRAADLVRTGLAQDEAMRRARLEFGIPDRYREEGRRARGLGPLDGLRVSALDLRLGWRMLVKYPGITIVGGLAMAFATWVGAGTFEIAKQVVAPSIPLPGGDRIVALRQADIEHRRGEGRIAHDLVAWRQSLRTVTALGAYRDAARNLIGADGGGRPVEVAEMSAAGFAVARVPALHGRTLLESDEQPGATPVLVLGHETWRQHFDADPAVVGRTVRLGRTPHVIVGVMPEGFAFPVAHGMWVPLRLDVLAHGRREGPAINVFGRLADGATLDDARAELAAWGQRTAREWRDSHERLRPEVLPYPRSVIDVSGTDALVVLSVNLPVLMLLVLVFGNVALLLFARAATREAELVVRTALGASRGRIVAQLFAEALVLGAVATTIGLLAVGPGLGWLMQAIGVQGGGLTRAPFWIRPAVSPTTVLYAALLTVLGAVIAGAMPARKLTRALQGRLKQASAGGGGLRFGGVWTAVIVAQVAVTVAFPVTVLLTRRDMAQIETADVGFPAREYLAARLEMDREAPPGTAADTADAAFRARFAASQAELVRRLRAEPAVVDLTFGDRLPRMYHPHRLIEVDAGGAAPLNPQWPGYRVSSARVDRDFFDVVRAPVLIGRGFRAADLTEGARAVVVNESFVRLVLGGRNPIGRRLRYTLMEERTPRRLEEPTPWYEIVGVVRDMGMAVGDAVPTEANGYRGDPKVAGIYHPALPGAVYPAQLAVHLRGDPAAFAPRLRALATAADPTLRVYEPVRLDDVNRGELRFLVFWHRLLSVVSAVALSLSLSGLYAVMAFTVARRTREIGIRIALGAAPWRILLAIFRRPLRQLLLGVAAGASLVTLMAWGFYGGLPPARTLLSISAYATVMLAVCLLACVVPTRRALAVEPTVALREEG